MKFHLTLALGLGLAGATQGLAQSDIESARAAVMTVYQRLASVRPDTANLDTWAQAYMGASSAAEKKSVLLQVAGEAVKEETFYSRTVLNFADPETNEEIQLNTGVALTDLTATIIGLIKDEADYRRILYDDVLYIPTPATFGAYSYTNNDAYTNLYNQVLAGSAPLSSSLQAATQTGNTSIPIQAGIYTLRGYGSVFYNAGTNRAPVRYSMIHYACRDMEQLSDSNRPDIYVRRDVERTPGGDGEKFRTECVGCHAGMDPLTSAFAYLDWMDGDDATVTYANAPVDKVNRNNDVFPNGFEVSDDSWRNLWIEGANSSLPWNTELTSGNGPKSFGEMLATSGMFPECMAQRVYQTVCFRKSLGSRDRSKILELSKSFVDANYNMKELFKNATVTCIDTLKL